MSNKRNGSPLEMGVTKRSSLDSPPVSGIESRPLTRSRLRASKVCKDPKRLGINFNFLVSFSLTK